MTTLLIFGGWRSQLIESLSNPGGSGNPTSITFEVPSEEVTPSGPDDVRRHSAVATQRLWQQDALALSTMPDPSGANPARGLLTGHSVIRTERVDPVAVSPCQGAFLDADIPIIGNVEESGFHGSVIDV